MCPPRDAHLDEVVPPERSSLAWVLIPVLVATVIGAALVWDTMALLAFRDLNSVHF